MVLIFELFVWLLVKQKDVFYIHIGILGIGS